MGPPTRGRRRTTMEPTTTIPRSRTILWPRCTQRLLQVGMQILTDLMQFAEFHHSCPSSIISLP